ncbi:MAG: hypothetical protein JXI43_00005 [Tissierellales bacterium]|nr:hypothetical protein [Tissierellales bacterium]
MTNHQEFEVNNNINSSIFVSGLFGVVIFFLAITLLFVIDAPFDRKPVYLLASISGTMLYICATVCMLMKKKKQVLF